MEHYDVKRYLLGCSINAEILAMETSNSKRLFQGLPQKYNEDHFMEKSNDLENLVYRDDESL